LPLKDITDLLVDGTIEDVRIRQHGLLVYPDPSSCRLSRTLVLKKDKPLLNFLVRFTFAKKLKEIQRMDEY
jgi:hypothetical protein